MPAEHGAGYFDTPARAERLQLLTHLLRNVDDIVYLRGPPGAGKTRLVQRLRAAFGQVYEIVEIDAGHGDDPVAATSSRLLRQPDTASPWPDSVMFALGDRELLLIVDNADRLDTPVMSQVRALLGRGAHVLLVGRGGMPGVSERPPSFVDLPAFDATETAGFIKAQPGQAATSDTRVAQLFNATGGLPGPLLDALGASSGSDATADPQPSPTSGTPAQRARHLGYLAMALGAAALILVLVFQDTINNALEESPDPAGEAADSTLPVPLAVQPLIERAVSMAPVDAGHAEVEVEDDELFGTAAVAPPVTLPHTEGPRTIAPGVPSAGAKAEPGESSRPAAPAVADSTGSGVSIDIPGTDVPDPLDEVLRDAAAAVAEKNEPVVGVVSPLEITEAQVAPIVPRPSAAPAAPVESASAAVEPTSDSASPATRAERAPPVDGPATPADSDAPDAVTPPITAEVARKPAPVIEKSSASVSRETPTGDWLRSRNPRRYTLQLVGARDRASIDRFVRKHAIKPPYAVFSRTLNGAPWYSLVAGDFPDRAAAVTARAALPAALGDSGIWPRTFESIHKLLK